MPAWPFGEHAGLGRSALVTSPTAYTSGNLVANVIESTAIHPSLSSPAVTTPGAP